MIYFSRRLSKKFVVDLSLFHKVREFKDGISFCDFLIGVDLYKGDHNPQFRVLLVLLNFKIIEFEIYNRPLLSKSHA